MSHINYQYLIEVDLSSSIVKLCYPSFDDEFPYSTHALFSSNLYKNYDTCVLDISKFLDNELHMVNRVCNSNYDITWEKKPKDADPLDWLSTEVLRFHVLTSDDWVFRVRLFAKDTRIIVSSTNTIH